MKPRSVKVLLLSVGELPRTSVAARLDRLGFTVVRTAVPLTEIDAAISRLTPDVVCIEAGPRYQVNAEHLYTLRQRCPLTIVLIADAVCGVNAAGDYTFDELLRPFDDRHLHLTMVGAIRDGGRPYVPCSPVDSARVSRRSDSLPGSSAAYGERATIAVRDSSNVGVMVTAGNGEIKWANSMVCTSLGYDHGSLLMRTVIDIAHDNDRAAIAQMLASVNSGSSTPPTELRLVSADGTSVMMQIEASVDTRSGCAGQLCLVMVDVTMQRRLEDQVCHTQRMEAVGRMAAALAHDFSNLLCAVLGSAELLRRELEPNTSHEKRIQDIMTAGNRATELTRQLMHFSRKDQPKSKVHDLGPILAELGGMLERLLEPAATLTVNLERGSFPVNIGAAQFEQIVVNLAVNARDAVVPESGEFILSLATADIVRPYTTEAPPGLEPGQYVVLTARDNGHGMSSETRARLFEPFYTTKPAGTGTGLGLATVYSIIRRIGGQIVVDSAPGCGSTFTVFLPLATIPNAEPESEPTARQVSNGDSETTTVLLVEDQEMVLCLISETLARQGYRVLAASDSAQALEVAQDNGIGMVITDVVLPRENGPELVRKLHDLNPELPVVYMSGYTRELAMEYGIKGEDRLLAKPISEDTLLSAVSECLSAK